MSGFYYARLVKPAKIRAGFDGGKPFYQDCIECDAIEPIIEGCIKCTDDDTVAVQRSDNGITFTPCYYCKACFNERAEEIEQCGK